LKPTLEFALESKKDVFDDDDARFIVQNIILPRLDIYPIRPGARVIYDLNLDRVLSSIEELEKTWSYTPRTKIEDTAHTYGRKHSGEKIGFWSVPKTSGLVLAYLVTQTAARTVLELGTSVGYSTLHLANAISSSDSDAKVFTIELLDEKVRLAQKHFERSGLNNKIELIQKDAMSVLSTWNKGLVDLVFLDADKENYANYFDLLVPIMKKGGLIIADNINDYGHMMEDYLQKVSGTHLPKSRCDIRVMSTYIAQLDNGLMITKKL